MSDPTTLLGYEMQAQSTPGWWDNLNAALQAIDDSIAGSALLNTTGGDTALTLNPYIADQSRLPIIRIGSGGNPITANIRITSLRKREYLVTNETTSGAFTVSFGYDTSNQVTIPRGYQCRVRNTADGGSIRTSPLVTIAAGGIHTDDIPEVSSAMLSAALQTTISTASSNAASAVAAASAAQATANATAALVVQGTESVTGILRLATAAEVVTGTDTAKAATAAGVKAHVDGRLATPAEVITGTSTSKVATPEGVAGRDRARAYAEATVGQQSSANIPIDGSTPQNDEGEQAISLSITIKKSTSRVRVMCNFYLTCNPARFVVISCFRDSGASAIGWVATLVNLTSQQTAMLLFEDAPGAAGTYTYKIRFGPNTSGTVTINGSDSSAKSVLILEEILNA